MPHLTPPQSSHPCSYPQREDCTRVALQHVSLSPRRDVGEVRQLTDAERERLIESAGEQMQAWVHEWERTGCFSARGCADFWLRRMRELIAGRSERQVRRLEVERGLV